MLKKQGMEAVESAHKQVRKTANMTTNTAAGTEHAVLADMLLDQLAHVSLVHHVRGRARLKVNWSRISALLAKGLVPDRDHLRRILEKAPGIRSWRINPKALSVVIEYDESIWPYRLWEDLAGLAACPQARPGLRLELLSIWAAQTANAGTEIDGGADSAAAD